jgi:hypothetical protein
VLWGQCQPRCSWLAAQVQAMHKRCVAPALYWDMGQAMIVNLGG